MGPGICTSLVSLLSSSPPRPGVITSLLFAPLITTSPVSGLEAPGQGEPTFRGFAGRASFKDPRVMKSAINDKSTKTRLFTMKHS